VTLLEQASYEDIVELLNTLPTTWYPALLVTMVEAAYKKPVFQPGGASRIIAKVEARIGKAKDVENESEVVSVDGDN
jgi:hypothetical protein